MKDLKYRRRVAITTRGATPLRGIFWKLFVVWIIKEEQ